MTKLNNTIPFLALLAFASCSGDCSCSGFNAKEFPVSKYDKTIPTTGSVRLTASGLTFLGDNLPAIIEGQLPGGLNFCIPKSADVCYNGDVCADGSQGCQMTISIDDANLVPKPTKTLDMSVTLGDLDEKISVKIPVAGNCFVKLHANGNDNLPATVEATIPIVFDVDAQSPTKDVVITTGETSTDISNLDFKITGNFLCRAGNLGFIKNLIKDQITGQIDPVLGNVLDSQLCVSCDMAACPNGSTCNADSICELPSGACLPQTLGVEGELLIGATLGDNSDVPDAKVDTFVRVADFAKVDTGLSLGLRNGYDPDALNGCVPADPSARSFTAPALAPMLLGDAKPNGDPYMIGLGYHKIAIEHLLWSTWGSGATCMSIRSAALTTSTLGIFLPSLKTVAFDKKSEAFIKIVPQTAPKVVLGANTVMPMGDTYKVIDPLMNIDWKDFDLHIFGYVQSRFTRIATIRIDLLLPIALVPTPEGQIVPVLGDIADAVKNPRVIAMDLLAEDPQRLIDVLPTFIGMALPALAGSISTPIDLPDFQGFKIVVADGDITSVANRSSIAIFADLKVATPVPLRSEMNTLVSGTEVSYEARSKTGLVLPELTVFVNAVLPSENFVDGILEDAQYSYRIDGGIWSLPHSGHELKISHPLLLIPGTHTVEVKARQKGDFSSEDRTPVLETFLIDYQAPEGELYMDGQTLITDVQDDQSNMDDLRMRFKMIGLGRPTWSQWSPIKNIDLSAPLSNSTPGTRLRAEVEVKDSVGNRVKLRHAFNVPGGDIAPKNTPTSTPSTALGCSTSNANAAPLSLLFLLGLFLTKRRKRKTKRKSTITRLTLSLIALALSLSSCDCTDSGTSAICECNENESCVEDKCVPKAASCQSDDDCDMGTCTDGVCVNEPTCDINACSCSDAEIATCTEEGKCECQIPCAEGCGIDEYCCYQSNRCQAQSDPCDEMMCDPGTEPQLQGELTYDSASCATKATCECVPSPPLPIGIHGQFSSLAKNANLSVIADYNTTYGDLMVGISTPNGDFDWIFVDGIPADGVVRGAADGPRAGIITSGEDVGTHTAIALDSNDNIHVFYRDEKANIMKYARGTKGADAYTFTTHVFDSDGDTGYWPSLIAEGDSVSILYAKKSVKVGNDYESQLVFSTVDLTSSADALIRTDQVVARGATFDPCGVKCPNNEICVTSLGQCQAEANDCPGMCSDGEGCYQGACVPTFEEPAAGTPKMVGGYAELSKTDNGFLAIYFDYNQDSLATSIQSSGTWSQPTFVGAGSGPFGSALIENGRLHMAFQNRITKNLEYNFDGGPSEIIATGLRDNADWWLVSDIGQDVNLSIMDSGEIVVIYQDVVSHSFHRALRSSPNMWDRTILSEPGMPYSGARGFYLTMLKGNNGSVFIETYINNQLEEPKGEPLLYE